MKHKFQHRTVLLCGQDGHITRGGHTAVQINPLSQLQQRTVVYLAANGHPVFFTVRMTGVGQGIGKRTVIGEQQQTL